MLQASTQAWKTELLTLCCGAILSLQMRKLLDTEASISLEAKAALEEAQGALATAKAEAAQQLAKLRRDLDHRWGWQVPVHGCVHGATALIDSQHITLLYHHAGIIGTFAMSNDENCNARQATKGSCLFRAVHYCREEKIRKLEQQLRTAYGSLGRAALRASGPVPDGLTGSVRVSRIGLAATQAPVAQSLDETIEVGLACC
jgi:hypothetical protein